MCKDIGNDTEKEERDILGRADLRDIRRQAYFSNYQFSLFVTVIIDTAFLKVQFLFSLKFRTCAFFQN